MDTYKANDILRIAKRFNNTKRTYLLVNPLQAKHIPVSPNESLRMMKTLGDMLAEKYPNTRLVIGFAETATAIGAAVAECFSPECIYIHTTRENVSGVTKWVRFLEEHSHAAEQKLAGDRLSEWITASESIIFVDDEISTGKTLINIIRQLRLHYPQLSTKRIVAASVLNRVSEEDEKKLISAGITCEYLLKLPQTDYSATVKDIIISHAPQADPVKLAVNQYLLPCRDFDDPRMGVEICRYRNSCEEAEEVFLSQFSEKIAKGASVLVLGTEESMFPALRLGARLEDIGRHYCVRCHATTRSPIGVCTEGNYPIVSGYRIRSFYASDRETYIYNLCEYDAVIIVTDTHVEDLAPLESLVGALPGKPSMLFCIQGGSKLWQMKC